MSLASHAPGQGFQARRLAAIAGAVLVFLPGAAVAGQLVTPDGPAVTSSKPAVRAPHFMAYSYRGTSVPDAREGVGLYAASDGKAVDLTSPDHLMSGPDGSLFNQAAGFGWRSHNVSAMFGYMKPSSVKSATRFTDERTPSFKNSARFGVGWALHF